METKDISWITFCPELECAVLLILTNFRKNRICKIWQLKTFCLRESYDGRSQCQFAGGKEDLPIRQLIHDISKTNHALFMCDVSIGFFV